MVGDPGRAKALRAPLAQFVHPEKVNVWLVDEQVEYKRPVDNCQRIVTYTREEPSRGRRTDQGQTLRGRPHLQMYAAI